MENRYMDFFIFRLARDEFDNLIINDEDGRIKVNMFMKKDDTDTNLILNNLYHVSMNNTFIDSFKCYQELENEFNNIINTKSLDKPICNNLTESMEFEYSCYMKPKLILNLLNNELDCIKKCALIYDGYKLSFLIDDIENKDIKDLQKLIDDIDFKR